MAKTYNPLGMGGCLLAANDKSGTRYGDWRASANRPNQRRALALNPTPEEIAKIPELERWASQDHRVLNRILEEHLFWSRFNPFKKGGFGALSILNVRLAWKEPGKEATVTDSATKKKYAGFRLSGRGCGVTVVDGKSPVARIETANGDVVLIQKADKEPEDDIAAAEAAAKLARSVGKKVGDKGALTTPLISFHEGRELEWFAGLAVPGKVEMENGFQEIRFGMNRLGARAQVATGGGFYATSVETAPVEFVLDVPAIIAVVRPGVVGPIFSAYITPEDWKDPGDLGEI
jgi:hypothetical protein